MRALILQRGLGDRSSAVVKGCFKMMKDEWLVNCCNGDPIKLLKFLDVETYEVVGESVMSALHKAGSVKLEPGQGLQQFLASSSDAPEGCFFCYNWQIKFLFSCHSWRLGLFPLYDPFFSTILVCTVSLEL